MRSFMSKASETPSSESSFAEKYFASNIVKNLLKKQTKTRVH